MAPSLGAWRDVDELPDYEHMASMACHERARHSAVAVQDVASAMSLPAWMSRINAACFASTLDFEDVMGASQHSVNLALEAPQPLHEEAAMVVLAGALDFGASWRDELHAYHEKGAWQTVKQGVESLCSLCPELKAEWLFHLSPQAVALHFGLNGAEPLQKLVEKFYTVVHEIGEGLVKKQVKSLAQYIMNVIDELGGDPQAAGKLVEELAETFPTAFKDTAHVVRLPIAFYKKAQNTACELYERFRLVDDRFHFADIELLTGNVDPLVIAVLRRHQVVMTTWDLTKSLESGEDLSSGDAAEVSLRAAGVAALEDMAWLARLKGYQVTPVMLGNYLWGWGKSEPLFAKGRHVCKETYYY